MRHHTKTMLGVLCDNAETLGITFKEGHSNRLLFTSLKKKKDFRMNESYEDIDARYHTETP